MVVSIINNKIKYTETPDIDDGDNGHSSDVFELDLFNASKTISVVLGKPKYEYVDKNVVYFPIYAISKEDLVGKIGVFEITTPQIVYIYGEDGSINLAKLSPPLLFSDYSEADMIDVLGADPEYYRGKQQQKKDVELDVVLKENNDNEFEVTVPQDMVSDEKRKSMVNLSDGIFTINSGFTAPAMLVEETAKQASDLRANFKKEKTNNWIEKRMKNNNYTILENEGNGDCFFSTVRDAYAQIGRITTVEKLREILANELTDEEFKNRMDIYSDFEIQKKVLKTQMEEMRKKLDNLQAMVDSNKYNTEEHKNMTDEAHLIAKDYEILYNERKEIDRMKKEYVGDMKGIKKIDDMRKHIKTQSFWADTWAISALERVLNMKMLIMSEDVYSEGDTPGVLQCGEAQNNTGTSISPEFYIITTLGNNHYRLVNYKNKGILTFSEVPYDLKVLVVNKCLERSSGAFYLVQDFRNFKDKLGLSADLGEPVWNLDDADIGLIDQSVKFIFYSNASKTPKPGMATGESIPEQKKSKFIKLAKIKDWRKQLDDMWDKAILTIDNHKWASVEHYVQGARYKKGFNDVYLMFSLDSGSEISKDVKKSGVHTGLKEGLRIDSDYGIREEEERKLALRAKFADNLDMKTLLINTDNALLLHREESGKELKPDIPLMKLRTEFM